MMAKRGVLVSHESIREWALKFGAEFAKRLRHQSARPGDQWHLNEVYLSIGGKRQYLWRAVNQDGEVLDILVPSRRNKNCRQAFLPQATQGPTLRSACVDCRQTGKLYGGEGGDHAECGSPARQGDEQPGREFISANMRAGETNAWSQISWACATLSCNIWCDHIVFPPRSSPAGGRELSVDHAPEVCPVEQNSRTWC